MDYRIVESYYRQEVFDFFRPYANPFYSITWELDATAVVSWAKGRGFGVYANLCYFFCKAAQGIDDFRYRLLDGQIVLYDRLDIGLTYPAEGGVFRYVNRPWDGDPERFNHQLTEVLAAPEEGPHLASSEHTNAFYFTAIPGIPFTSFAHATPADTTEGAARVAFGMPTNTAGRRLVSVGMTVNHLFVDGAALGRLAEAAAEVFADPG